MKFHLKINLCKPSFMLVIIESIENGNQNE